MFKNSCWLMISSGVILPNISGITIHCGKSYQPTGIFRGKSTASYAKVYC